MISTLPCWVRPVRYVVRWAELEMDLTSQGPAHARVMGCYLILDRVTGDYLGMRYGTRDEAEGAIRAAGLNEEGV